MIVGLVRTVVTVTFKRAPGHRDIVINEKADKPVRQGSKTNPVGPGPIVGIRC